MPFTVSHAVAVIPLYKYLGKYGAMSALIIGSMTPDIAYLTPFLVHQRVESHSLIGLFLYCIPMGLSVYLFYHWLIAPVVCSLFPRFIQKHLSPDLLLGRIPALPVHIVLFSLIIGAVTHIVWDYFTHQYGIARHIAWMDTPLSNIDGYDIMPYRVLQHFSTLFGLSLLMFWGWRWIAKRKQPGKLQTMHHHTSWNTPDYIKRLSLISLITIPAVVGAVVTLLNIPDSSVLHGLHSIQLGLKEGVIAAASAFLLCCLILGLYYQYRISIEVKSR